MARLFRPLTRLKQRFSRTRNLFACTHFGANAANPTNEGVPPSVQYKESRSESTLQINSPSNCTINATSEPLAQSFVAWDHNGSANIYLGDGHPSASPGDLRPLTESHPNLLRILGVAISCGVPPSVIRISRVLSLPEEEVNQSVQAIAIHLRIPVNLEGNIKLPGAFIFAMYRSCLQIMGAAHGYIACWCLQAAMSEPQHIDYALSYWAWHVSQATPSVELTIALGKFPFVLCTVTENQISDVIHWLKRFNGLIDASHLILQYEERLRTLVEIPLSER
ncbi:hypothetical protein MSAN_00972000 [Mycena sanguinolenta]|uniref:Uncharacterized protein n=1 Tax=Mycena sanguinolenta TaxID=230812 RepID=A0A8H7DCJ0_9AGAR|nr:hypothetical protein MSAN_00972000 [Mycena sanguinolenta]